MRSSSTRLICKGAGMQKHEFIFEGNNATVIIPDNFHGEWIWKTEFLYAFDQAERALTDEGYARVYYEISDRYGSYILLVRMLNFCLRK